MLAANQRFYDAFEAGDLDAMSDLWEHSDRVVCTHPGWNSLRSWASIAASFFALFQGGQEMQFILTGTHVEVVGDVAWVSLDENLLATDIGGTMSAVNVFVRVGGEWRLVVHHSSPIASSQP